MDEENTDAVVTNTDEELELDLNLEDSEDVVTLTKAEHAELVRKAEQFPNVVARAKAAEAKLKTPPPPQPLASNALSADDVDVKILQSQGVDEASLEYLKKIAKVNGTSILAAQSDELFVAFKDKKEREDKAQRASVGASKGSGSSQKGKTVNSVGLSEAEHKELWRKAQGIN